MKMNLPGVHGGVSQQSPSLRLQNQHESASNVIFDVLDGIKTRWPLRRLGLGTITGMKFIGSIKTTDSITWCAYHKYVAGTYTLTMVPDDIGVSTVVLTGSSGYLATVSDNLKTYGILDTLLLLNADKEVTVTKTDTTIYSSTWNWYADRPTGLIYVPRVYDGNTCQLGIRIRANKTTSVVAADTLLLNKMTGILTVASGDSAEDLIQDIEAAFKSTVYPAELNMEAAGGLLFLRASASEVDHSGTLYYALKSSLGVTPGTDPTVWQAFGPSAGLGRPAWAAGTQYYSLSDLREAEVSVEVYVDFSGFDINTYSAFAIVSDPLETDPKMRFFCTAAASFESLPPNISGGTVATSNIMFRLGDAGYYVRFNVSTGTFEEAVAFGHKYNLVKENLPHELRYTVATNSWALSSVASYETNGRLVGDSTSAPLPLFVGRKLNSLFYYRNRLCFLSQNTVSMSRVGNFYQFFPDTATEVLDSDPISVYPAYKDYSPLLYGIPYNKQLLLIGPDKQYVLHSGYDALSPTTVAIDEATSYKLLPQMEPLLLENSLVLFLDQGEYAGLLEYQFRDQEIATEGAILTDNVPRYIPNDITNAVYLQSEHMILCYKQQGAAFYVYKFHKNEQGQRMQSAWTRWDFPAPAWSAIVSMVASSESKLLFHSVNALYTMSTDEDVLVTPSMDIFIEGDVTDGAWTGIGLGAPTDSIVIEKATGKQLELDEDYKLLYDGTGTTVVPVWIGRPIPWSVELSPLILRDNNGLPRSDIKSTIRNMQIDWSGGDFKVKTFGTNLPTRTTEITPVTYQIHEITPGESMREVHPSRVLVMADSKRCRVSIESSGFNHVKIHNIAYNLEIRKDKG